ncbi:SPY protein [Magnetospirillum sp. ME-1]|uniref:tetratricopeptide repeat protein n=1 Tax=Magnetospirillum sp. ME-1 TaxID=1639348 RepID=UPI000A17CE55|nr:tetratricopeptide repeat protein [Magnetospirillum sp. ME-1]ARJ65546.1 SPY protein [Magnetospirillum sp. ME-1]
MIEDILAQAQAAHRAGKHADAESSYRRVLAARPDHTEAMYALGVLMAQSRRVSESMDLLKRASCLAPEDARIARNLALVLQAAGRPKEAEAEFIRLCEMEPGVGEHRFGLALLYSAQGRHQDCVEQFRKGLALAPDNADAWCNLGLAYRAAGENQDALEAFARAVSVSPAMVKAHGNRGALLMALGRWEEAVEAWDRLLALDPGIAEVYADKGVALAQLGRIGDAADCFRRAEELDSNNALYPYNLGRALQDQGCLPEAAEAYDRATARDPEYVSAYLNMGVVLRRMGNVDLALNKYARVIELQPDNGAAHLNRGKLLTDQSRFDEALSDYRRAVELMPDDADSRCELVHARRQLCDWDDLAADEEVLRALVRAGADGGVDPFVFMSLDATPGEQLACARLWAAEVEQKALSKAGRLAPARPSSDGPIRLGYLSADFRRHPGAQIVTDLLERHDRGRFTVHAYSCGPDDDSEERRRVMAAVDQFTDIADLDLAEAAARIRDDGIDILINLSGYTQYNRTGLLALRPAPVQVSYLGYVGTLGADFADYLVVDPVVVPPSEQEYFTERLVYLPHCYLPSDSSRALPPAGPGRAEMGLPEDGIVFCAFHGHQKITPSTFKLWMEVLGKVPGSVLWLLDGADSTREFLRGHAGKAGIDSDRLVFAPRVEFEAHLDRHRLADLFLDALPYNAHGSAVDALWMGLPLLTREGSSFPGRVASSVLQAAGLPELVTRSPAAFVETAVALANDPARLAGLRRHLEEGRGRLPLFDNQSFTRDLERAYELMIERARAGLPPEAFSV